MKSRSGLSDKQGEFGEAASLLVERMLPLLKLDEKYMESYGVEGTENFIVVPIDFSDQLTEHIRGDLSQPLQFLLLVEDSTGHIRRGDLVQFYPDSNIVDLPLNAFNQYFTTQTFPVDGTFQLVSLNNIKQYEMLIDSSKPKEFHLWEGRAPVYEGNNILCIDWYELITTYYYDGSIEEEIYFLGTQCYGQSGGGGGGGASNGTTPPVLTQCPVTKTVSFHVGGVNQGLEHWAMHADYTVSGVYFPNNVSSNYFDAAPVSLDGGHASTSHLTYGNPHHTVPGHAWYHTFNLLTDQTSLLNNNKTAKAQFLAHLFYPLQSFNQHRYPGGTNYWQASSTLY